MGKQSTSAPAPPNPQVDQVIQMLASQAAIYPRLKTLMKRVAMSKASPAQFAEFQSHIAEVQVAIARQERQEAESFESASPPTDSSTASTSGNSPAPTLLRLPLEIREMIWEYASPPEEIWFCQGANQDHMKWKHDVCVRKYHEFSIRSLSSTSKSTMNSRSCTEILPGVTV